MKYQEILDAVTHRIQHKVPTHMSGIAQHMRTHSSGIHRAVKRLVEMGYLTERVEYIPMHRKDFKSPIPRKTTTYWITATLSRDLALKDARFADNEAAVAKHNPELILVTFQQERVLLRSRAS